MTSTESTTDRENTIVREFAVPVAALFTAFTTPEHTMKWFGPVGWPLTLCEMDFRVGGKWRFAMTGDSGVQSTPFGGTYLEIVPNRRIKFDNSFEEAGSKTMIMTWEYEDLGSRSRLTMTTLFESVEMKDEYLKYGMEEGVASSFDQLAGVAAEIAHH